MIPSARLIWITGLVGFPAAMLEALVPAARPFAIVLVLVLVLAAVADLMIRKRALEGISVELPALMRLVHGREAQVGVLLRNEQARVRRVRVGFASPEGVELDPEQQELDVPAGTSRVDWLCVPGRRGTHEIAAVYLEAASPLGLWTVRRRQTAALEIRVYPNLRDDGGLQAMRRGVENRHAVRQVGRGREFEKLREYSAGDGADEIHWKAAARRGRPITKVFQVERTQEIYLVVDASRLSAREVDGEPMLERAIKAALTVGAVTERRGDLFGVAAFSDHVEAFVRAKAGKTHYAACREAINELRPREQSPDFEEIATFLQLRLRRRSLILFLTSLDDPILAERFERATQLLARRHVVVAASLRPEEARPLFENAEIQSTDEIYGALAGHLGWTKLRELQGTLARRGVRLALFEPQAFAASVVGLYDDVKQRQLL